MTSFALNHVTVGHRRRVHLLDLVSGLEMVGVRVCHHLRQRPVEAVA